MGDCAFGTARIGLMNSSLRLPPIAKSVGISNAKGYTVGGWETIGHLPEQQSITGLMFRTR